MDKSLEQQNKIKELELLVSSLKQQRQSFNRSWQYQEDYLREQIKRLENRCYNLNSRLCEKQLYYAVITGKTGGVFINWLEVENAIENYNGAIVKTFESMIGAKNFISQTLAQHSDNVPAWVHELNLLDSNWD